MLKEKALQALQQEIKTLFLGIGPTEEPEKITKNLQELVMNIHVVFTSQNVIFKKNPGYILSSIISNHGILPLIDCLSSSNQSVIDATLRVISEVHKLQILSYIR